MLDLLEKRLNRNPIAQKLFNILSNEEILEQINQNPYLIILEVCEYLYKHHKDDHTLIKKIFALLIVYGMDKNLVQKVNVPLDKDSDEDKEK